MAMKTNNTRDKNRFIYWMWVNEPGLKVYMLACFQFRFFFFFSSTLPCKLWWTWPPQTAYYVFTRGSCRAPPPCAASSLGSTLGVTWLALFVSPSLRNDCLILPDVHYLKTTFHLFYLAFSLFQVGEHFQSLLLSSHQKQKFKHFPHFSFE